MRRVPQLSWFCCQGPAQLLQTACLHFFLRVSLAGHGLQNNVISAEAAALHLPPGSGCCTTDRWMEVQPRPQETEQGDQADQADIRHPPAFRAVQSSTR